MCPLSALSQILVLLFMLLLCGTALVQSLVLRLGHKNITVNMNENAFVNYTVEDDFISDKMYCLVARSEDENIAKLKKDVYIINNDSIGSFDIFGNFLGRTNIFVELKECSSQSTLQTEKIKVRVIREERVIDHIFTGSVIVLVSVLYINFGCALNWEDIKTHIKRPIAVIIGFVGQFVLMPLLSYVIGVALFPANPAMQLGIFFTGCAPGGGGSNIWAALLDANIDLSITMTTLSTFVAFGTIPLWTFTLGSLIFDKGNIAIPYRKIATSAVGLVIPLTIGFLLQRYTSRVSGFLRRSLKIFSGCLIIFIIIFAIVTNLYLFHLFSWEIILSSMGLPWLGYMGGWLLAKAFKQPPKDALTVAIEVGLQNTGIAIFMLRTSLPQPEADLTTIAPVAVSIMTPIPLFILFLIKMAKEKKQLLAKQKYALNHNINSDNEMDNTPAELKQMKNAP